MRTSVPIPSSWCNLTGLGPSTSPPWSLPFLAKSGFGQGIIIVAFLENATIGYSLESLCVCVCVCVRVCVCVCFCTMTQKEIDLGTRNWNTL